MIALLVYVAIVCAAVLVPVLVCARYLEWRAWDADRRIARLRARRQAAGLPRDSGISTP